MSRITSDVPNRGPRIHAIDRPRTGGLPAVEAIDRWAKPQRGEGGTDVQQDANQSPGTTNQKTPQRQAGYSFLAAGGQTPHKYNLELYDDPKKPDPIATVDLPYVNSLTMSQPLAVARTWTFDGSVYEEHSGFAQRTFRIQGRSGFSPRALTKFARFRNFLEKYARLSQENRNAFVRAKDIRLAINFLWEGEAFWVTVVDFQYTRETNTTRMSFAYQLTLVTNGVASARWNPDNGLSYMNCNSGSGDECHLDERHYCAKAAELALVQAPPQQVRKFTNRTLVGMERIREFSNKTLAGEPDRVINIYNYVVIAIRDIMQTVLSIKDMVERAEFRNLAKVLLRWLIDTKLQIELEAGAHRFNLGDILGFAVDLIPGDGRRWERGPTPFPSRGVPVVTVPARANDTAHDIAQRHLGDRNLWRTIVLVNGWHDARTKADGSFVTKDDTVLVPSASGLSDIDQASFYGTSFLIENGDLVSVGDVDIALVDGLPNFFQNFRHRMRTVRGANATYPDFGLRRVVPDSELSDPAAQLLTDVQRQAMSDHRVSEVTELSLVEGGDFYDVALAVTTALQEKRRAAFSYKL